MAWSFGSARLHGSLEWFDAIDPYVVIQGDSLYAQVPDGEGMVPEAVAEQSDILNWALAVEYAFSETLSGYLSFRQDNSALAEDMCFNELYGLGYLAGREYPEKIDDVRQSDVRDVADRYLNPDIRAEIIVGPQDAIEAAAGG